MTNITSARGTLHCRKTRIPCGDQLVICGQYMAWLYTLVQLGEYVPRKRRVGESALDEKMYNIGLL
jgi:hypothetical protein